MKVEQYNSTRLARFPRNRKYLKSHFAKRQEQLFDFSSFKYKTAFGTPANHSLLQLRKIILKSVILVVNALT